MTADMTEREFVPGVVFRDCTALLVSDAYASAGASTYQSSTRIRSDVFYAGENALAWANGKQITDIDGAIPLMTMTKDSESGACVTVYGSTEFGAQEYVQSAVFGNSDAVLCALREMGKQNVLIGLHYKPFSASVISVITTTQKLNWTLSLTLIPAAIVAGVAIVVLVRRKYS